MVCLGELRSFCHFWDCTQILHFGVFCWLWGLLHYFKRFLPTVIDIMTIISELNASIFIHFSSLISKTSVVTLAFSCFTPSSLPWFGPNTPGSYAILFFTALDFTFTTRHIHNWASFSFWLSLFIFSGSISVLFSSSILDTYRPGGSPFRFIYFCLFILFMGFSRQECWRGLSFPSPVGHICQGLTSRDMPFSHSTWLDDMPGALVVPRSEFCQENTLVFLECLNLH